jgi:hypothetical protein
MQSAEMTLKEAEDLMEKKKYREARKSAKSARDQANLVQDLSSTFRLAKLSLKNASAVNYLWRDTGDILKEAEAAANKGDSETAVKLAKKAQAEADGALNQYYMEMASYIVRSLEAEGKGKAPNVEAAKAALEAKDGKKAYDLTKNM